MTIDALTLSGLISILPLILFTLLRGQRVCEEQPECDRLPRHLRGPECCPAD